MGNRAVLFAIENRDLKQLLSARLAGDNEVLQVVAQIEQHWDSDWLQQLDKSWEAIHRCLTDGEFEFENGKYPLNLCILGGLQLYGKEDYIVSLKSPQECNDIAQALQTIDEKWMAERYAKIAPNDYDKSEEDFEYTWNWFSTLPAFYSKVAEAKRAVIFTVDL